MSRQPGAVTRVRTIKSFRQQLLVWLGCLVWTSAAATVSVTDDTGNAIRLDRPADRIISLAPHMTELLYAAGAGNSLVGAVRYSDYPPPARDIPRVGDAHSFDIEQILALEPDLIIAWQSGNPAGQMRQLRELGLTLFVSEPRSLSDIPATIEKLGRLAGTAPAATAAAIDFRRRLTRLRDVYSDRPPVDVFYQIWHQPLITIGGGHVINDVIRLCGGRNVFADTDQLAPQISIEAVLAAAPEVIIASGTGDQRPEWLNDWQQWPQLPAVQQEQLHFIPPYQLQRHTPRILEGTARLCEILEQARVHQ